MAAVQNTFITNFTLPASVAALQVSAQINSGTGTPAADTVVVTRSDALAPITQIQFYLANTTSVTNNIASNGQVVSTTFLSPANEFSAPSAVTTTWSTTSGGICTLYMVPTASEFPLTVSVAIPDPDAASFTVAKLQSQRATELGVVFVCASPTGVITSGAPEMVVGFAGVEDQGDPDSNAVLTGAGIAYYDGSSVPAFTLPITNTSYPGLVSGIVSPNLVHALFSGTILIASSGGGGTTSASFWRLVPNAGLTAFDVRVLSAEDTGVTFLASGLCNADVMCAYSGWGATPYVWIADLSTDSPSGSHGEITDSFAAEINWSNAHMYEWPEHDLVPACMWVVSGDTQLHTLLVYPDGTPSMIYHLLSIANEVVTAVSFVDATPTKLRIAFATQLNTDTVPRFAYTATFDTVTNSWSDPTATPINQVSPHAYTNIVSVAGSRKSAAGIASAVTVMDQHDIGTLWTTVWQLADLP